MGDLYQPPSSLVDSSVQDHVEDEKCVVAQYRTTSNQKNTFVQHLSSHSKEAVPIEWVIDIADESNGWFYGTAYHYNDQTQMLHVMVPDKENPSFDGQVLLDHRTVHLIECVDGKSEALFNKIIRDSVIKVKWDVEWFEESEPDGNVAGEAPVGSWIISSARYYIRIANQLLVEDKEVGQDTRGFVILTADLNLKLLACHKNKGLDDFNRLVMEGSVQSTPEALAAAKEVSEGGGGASPVGRSLGGSSRKRFEGATSPHADRDANGGDLPLRKLTEMSRNLREAISEMLEEREKAKSGNAEMAKVFGGFLTDGNLEKGMQLLAHFSAIDERATAFDKEDDKADTAGDDAWYFAKKIESSLSRRLKNSGD